MKTSGSHSAGWKGAPLATQYAVASGVVLVIAGFLIGTFIAGRIEENVVRNSANSTALFMESVLSPIGQQLATQDELSPGSRQGLEEIFLNTPIGDRVVSYKIWKPGGLIVEASDPSLVGQTFPVTDNLESALNGEVAAEFGTHGDDEDAGEQALGIPLLEIYSPIREYYSGEIIAVAEFYEFHEQLEADLAAARRDSWLTVAGVVSGLGIILYLIVLRGSRMIVRQQHRLENQFGELQALSQRNRDLRNRVRDAAGRSAETSEHSLRQIGADLHDGPAQQLAYAALRLDGLRDLQGDDSGKAEVDAVETAVDAAMTEIRAISRGLALPEVAGKNPVAIVRMAVDEHQNRTGNRVDVDLEGVATPKLPLAANICLYRFVQEGLNNSSRHAGAEDMKVWLTCESGHLTLKVLDSGPGIQPAGNSRGLGLSGLRNRVESLGGAFRMGTPSDCGGELVLEFDLGEWT